MTLMVESEERMARETGEQNNGRYGRIGHHNIDNQRMAGGAAGALSLLLPLMLFDAAALLRYC